MDFISECRKFVSDFTSNCCDENNRIPYIPKGILNVEAFYWWSLVAIFRPDMILESGVALGRSTEILARAQLFYDIPHHYAFDITPLHEKIVRNKLRNHKTRYLITDSAEGFNDVLKSENGNAIVILDGPKSYDGIKSVIKCLARYKDRIMAIGCHDCDPSCKVRKYFEKCCKDKLEREVVFTQFDQELAFLNDCLSDEIRNTRDKNYEKLISKSHCIGVCL